MGRLSGCCGCFNLRDGSRAIGITMLVLVSLLLVVDITYVLIQSQHENSHMNTAVVVARVVRLALGILQLLMNALLVHGVNKNSRGMLLAWLIYSGIINGLDTLTVVVVFIVACISGNWWLLLLVLAVGGKLGLFWYWFVVVLHCYQEMRDEKGFVYGKQENEGEKHAL